MDLLTILISVLSSGMLVALGVPWLVKRTVDHGLAVRLTTYKSELDTELTRFKASLDAEGAVARAHIEASLREATERVLGEEAADRSYRYDAKKRLYEAVGPLRFQLVGASVQFLSRLMTVAEHSFEIDTTRYFGRSLLYRVARILALTELIERKTVYADFSVDTGMIKLLRFRSQILRALSSDDVVLQHPLVDWTTQREHLFRDNIPVLASCLIIDDGAGARVLRFEEFEERCAKEEYIQPLRRIISDLNPSRTPILWLRLLAMAEASRSLIEGDPIVDAIEPVPFDLEFLVDVADDDHVKSNRELILSALNDFRM